MKNSQSNQDKGAQGESTACQYLKRLGYKIIAQNFRTRLGEIDLVAVKGGLICFVEVKTRLNLNYGYPLEAVTGFKKRKLMKAVWYFLLKNPLYQKFEKRMSVLSLCIKDGEEKIDFYENAFEVSV